MLKLRKYQKEDAKEIVTWIKDEKAFGIHRDKTGRAGVLCDHGGTVEMYRIGMYGKQPEIVAQ